MSGYGVFAKYYDELTSNVDYRAIAECIKGYTEENGKESQLLVDLACGTGSLSVELSKLGFDVIGVDSSCEMLSEAIKKSHDGIKPILFLNQSISKLDLYGTVDVAVCALDSINHITDIDELNRSFQKVSLFLEPDGIFIFDVNTPYKHEVVLADNTFVYDCDNIYCVWQNSTEGSKTQINLDFFEYDDGAYYRSSESFFEIAYSDEAIEKLLSDNGLFVIAKYDGYSKKPVAVDTQRIVYVVGKV